METKNTPPGEEEGLEPKIYNTGFPGDEEAWCLWWHNPWDGKPEKIAYFIWPGHPAEATKFVEDLYERLATDAISSAARQSMKEAVGEARDIVKNRGGGDWSGVTYANAAITDLLAILERLAEGGDRG